MNLLSVWSASILVSKHFPILHTPSTVSIRTPAAAASSILIDELAELLFRDIVHRLDYEMRSWNVKVKLFQMAAGTLTPTVSGYRSIAPIPPSASTQSSISRS